MAKHKRKRKPDQPRRRKLSLMVLHRTKDAMELCSSIHRHKGRPAKALGKRFGPRLLAGEEPPDWQLTLTLIARDAQAALERLIELDDEVDYKETSGWTATG